MHQIFPPKYYPGEILNKIEFTKIDQALNEVMKSGDLLHDRRCALGVANEGTAKLSNPQMALTSGDTHAAIPPEVTNGQTSLNLFYKSKGEEHIIKLFEKSHTDDIKNKKWNNNKSQINAIHHAALESKSQFGYMGISGFYINGIRNYHSPPYYKIFIQNIWVVPSSKCDSLSSSSSH